MNRAAAVPVAIVRKTHSADIAAIQPENDAA